MPDTDVSALPHVDWMPAREALALVDSRNGSAEAAFSIAIRALSGALRASADRIVKEQKTMRGGVEAVTAENAELEKEFWWAEGEAALDQNWRSGDFSTYIDDKYRWQAFGVKFDPAGIKAMLAPAEKEALAEPNSMSCSSIVTGNGAGARQRVRGRSLSHDHPYAAAMAALKLARLPEAERARLTGPSVGVTMQEYYILNAGKSPHEDNLDDHGTGVLRALREHWQQD